NGVSNDKRPIGRGGDSGDVDKFR
ncbi:unnamed protein product, partial [Mesorhabditis spiculigera]